MRNLEEIVLHCTATPEGRDVSADTIRGWHLRRGWSDIGYHFVIRLDGTIEVGRPIERMGAHVKGHNAYTIGVSYVGGVDLDMNPKDTMTEAQQEAFCGLVDDLRHEYGGHLTVCGHNDFPGVRKACPSFKVNEKFPML